MVSVLWKLFVHVWTHRYVHIHTHPYTLHSSELDPTILDITNKWRHLYVNYVKEDNKISWILFFPNTVIHFNYHYILRALYVSLVFQNILLKLSSYFEIFHGSSDHKNFYFIYMLAHSPALSFLSSLCFSFLIHKMGITLLPMSKGCFDELINHYI